jgi:hypothetical protein
MSLLSSSRESRCCIVAWAAALAFASTPACDQLLGIEETSQSSDSRTGGTSSGGQAGEGTGGLGGSGRSGGDVPNGSSGEANAGEGGVASEPSPNADWTPGELPGLALWLNLDSVERVLESAGVWRDESPYHHEAQQADPARRPLLVERAFGTRSGLEFDGIDDFLSVADHPALRLGTRPFILEVVYSQTTSVSTSNFGTIVFSKQDPMPPFAGIGVFANHPIADHNSNRHAVQIDFNNVAFSREDPRNNDGTPWLMGFQRLSVDEFGLRLNGELVDLVGTQTGRVIDVDALGCMTESGAPRGCEALIGGSSGNSNQLRGRIAEIVLAEISGDDEIAMLEGYLVGKYREALDSR